MSKILLFGSIKKILFLFRRIFVEQFVDGATEYGQLFFCEIFDDADDFEGLCLTNFDFFLELINEFLHDDQATLRMPILV